MAKISTIPKFKLWLMEKEITQKKLRELTNLSTLPVNNMVNKGVASKSTISHVALALNISREELTELLITEDNKHLYQD